MDMQALMDMIADSGRRTRSYYHLTLGRAIKKLGEIAPGTPITALAGGVEHPHSYRGYYSDLALEPSPQTSTCGELLMLLQSALGQTFDGYKGGDFVMGPETPLWLASYGCGGLAITDLVIQDGAAVLVTRAEPEE